MSVYFCPRCGCAGVQSHYYNYCTRCLTGRQAKERSRRSDGAPKKVMTKNKVDENAMKGFSPLSQEFLTRKLI